VAETDVVVVGAGPSGATTALLLSRAGHDVVLIDRARFPRDKACGEGLMPPGVELLRRLSLYEQVLAAGARALPGVTYQHPGSHPVAYAPFPVPPDGGAQAGLGVRRTTFDAVLVDAVRREPHATVREGVRATGLLRSGSGKVDGITTADGDIRAQVVVAADGLHSNVRAWAGLAMQSTAPLRYGLAGHWRTDVSERRGITVTLAGDHEWYEAPVGPDVLLVSVLSRRSHPPITARTYALAAQHGVPAIRDGDLVSGPLGAAQFHQRARAVAEGSVFLVGDASGYDDPTTGDGIALGMLLAERVAEHIRAVLDGRISVRAAAARYAKEHAGLVRERRRLTRLALLMARSPRLSGRALAHAAGDPGALSKLLAINCGYQAFRNLSLRDWLSLAGI
jgi:flavin-dependent dehydrogenase